MKAAVLLLNSPSLLCEDLDCIFLCAYVLQNILLLHTSWISLLTTLAELSSSISSSTFQKRMSLGWQMSRNLRQMVTVHIQGSFVSSLEQVQENQSSLKPLGMCCPTELCMHCKSGQPVHAQLLHNTCTICQMLAVDIPHLYASCLGTFDQKNARPLANSKFIWSWNINCLARSPAQGIFLWLMWSGRHYMFPVIVLCHMLSFNCFSYLDVVFFFFHLYIWSHTYMALHHIYFMNDSYDPGSHLWLLSCLPLFIYSLCPPLSEITLFFLLEMFHLTTAAVVILFLLYIS